MEKTEGMDNPETLATLGTQDTGRRQIKQKNTRQKIQKVSNMDPTKNWGVNPGAHER